MSPAVRADLARRRRQYRARLLKLRRQQLAELHNQPGRPGAPAGLPAQPRQVDRPAAQPAAGTLEAR
ncbi:hypothetical protein [Kribbella monticola]|uniref:hypothetical protein n=1 Tax=Kribbella monticola TaxID=2185285 RepID=UPI0018E502E5|nr:hypothetical protein [Kribbella monticola]